MYSFYMLVLIYLLVLSEKYFLLVVTNVLFLGLITLTRNHYHHQVEKKKHLESFSFLCQPYIKSNGTKKFFK